MQRRIIKEVLVDGVEQECFSKFIADDPESAAAIVVSLQNGLLKQLGIDTDAYDAKNRPRPSCGLLLARGVGELSEHVL